MNGESPGPLSRRPLLSFRRCIPSSSLRADSSSSSPRCSSGRHARSFRRESWSGFGGFRGASVTAWSSLTFG